MTGKQLIQWIKDHEAEEMDILQIDDGYAVYSVYDPKIVKGKDIKKMYNNTTHLKEDKDYILI